MMQLFQKNEPGIQRETEKKCMICTKEFKIGRKEHQCKRCYRAVCSDCGKDKTILYMQDFVQQPHRNCKICTEDTKGVKDFINSNKLIFGTMSTLGQKWYKKLQVSHQQSKLQQRKNTIFTRQLFNLMWNSYNYSMREFIGLLTFSSSQQDIYSLVLKVVSNLLNFSPKQNIQNVAYLSMFLLCFYSPDKAIALGIYLLQLKNTVTDSQGLVQAYLKALGLSQEEKIRSYIKDIANKFISSFSINIAHIMSSIYLVEKVITRKKIEQVYIFFTLSLDVIKEQILKEKFSHKYHNILFSRLCTPNAISGKYRQAAAVKSSLFLKQKSFENNHKEDNKLNNQVNQHNLSYHSNKLSQGPKFSKKISTYTEIQNNQHSTHIQQDPQSFPQENLSMLSMIEELKELQRPPQTSESNQIFAILNTRQSKRIQQQPPQLFNEFAQHSGSISPIRLSPNQNELKSLNYCESCQEHKTQIMSLKRQLQQYYKLTDTLDRYKQENQRLKQKIKRGEGQASSNKDSNARYNILLIEKTELQSQIKKLKQNTTQYQNKQKQYHLSNVKMQELNKQIKRLELQVRTLQAQLQQSNNTNIMLNNRLESRVLESITPSKMRDSYSYANTEGSNSEGKITALLKQSIKQKNSQIQELTKKNKFLAYQIEQGMKSKRDGKQQTNIKQKLQKLQSERQAFMRKIKELVDKVLEEQSQKLRLSEQNFIMRQIMRENKLSFQ